MTAKKLLLLTLTLFFSLPNLVFATDEDNIRLISLESGEDSSEDFTDKSISTNKRFKCSEETCEDCALGNYCAFFFSGLLAVCYFTSVAEGENHPNTHPTLNSTSCTDICKMNETAAYYAHLTNDTGEYLTYKACNNETISDTIDYPLTTEDLHFYNDTVICGIPQNETLTIDNGED